MSPNDLDAPLGSRAPSEAAHLGLMRDIPWGGLALAGMGLIAVSLVAFVIITDEKEPPRQPAALIETAPPKRIAVPEIPPAAAGSRAEDAVSSIARTIRPAAVPDRAEEQPARAENTVEPDAR